MSNKNDGEKNMFTNRWTKKCDRNSNLLEAFAAFFIVWFVDNNQSPLVPVSLITDLKIAINLLYLIKLDFLKKNPMIFVSYAMH
jgi:hypothetical protein